MIVLHGNPDFKSEGLIAYEIGCRFYSGRKIFFDLSTFYNVYNHLFSGQLPPVVTAELIPIPHLKATLMTANQITGCGYGYEAALDWQTSDCWQQRIGYTFTKLDVHLIEGSQDTGTVENIEGQCPLHQLYIRSSLDLPYRIEMDFGLRYMDDLSELDIKAYWNADCRIAWKPVNNVCISMVGQNIFHADILEFIPELDYSFYTKSQRGVYGSVSIHF